MLTADGTALEAEPDRAEQEALRQYYKQTDFLFSAEGVLKVVAMIACIGVSALYLTPGAAGCGGAAPLPATAAGVALAAACAAALLLAAYALQLPLCAPQLWLFMDIIVSAVLGVLLLAVAVLGLVFCGSTSFVGYLRAPVGVAAAASLVGSAGVTFAAVARRWDAARPAREPRPPSPAELDA